MNTDRETIFKNMVIEPSYHKKGWGEEIWLVNSKDYCAKFLDIKAGKEGSLHFHKLKHETWYVLSGIIIVTIIDTSTAEHIQRKLYEGDILDIHPLVPHRIKALEDSRILEVSTQHFEDDSYRVAPGDSQSVFK